MNEKSMAVRYTDIVSDMCDRVILAAEFILSEFDEEDYSRLSDALSLGVYMLLFADEFDDPGAMLSFLGTTREHAAAALRLAGFVASVNLSPTVLSEEASGLAAWFLYDSSPFLERYVPESVPRETSLRAADADDKRMFPMAFYLLNMVGAGLLNRAGYEKFQDSRRKMILAPACMAAPEDGICYSILGSSGRLCTGCSRSCPTGKLKQVATGSGADLSFIRHSGEVFSSGLAVKLAGEGYGVLGIACIPSLLEGGWKALAAGLPVQCVPLNYSGCLQWGEDERVTVCDLGEVAAILGSASGESAVPGARVLMTA